MRNSLIILWAILMCLDCTEQAPAKLDSFEQTLWKGGSGNYKGYRIPSLITTKKGTLLAFAEGREAGDTGDIDLIMKSSSDQGKSWSKTRVVWNDGQNT